LHDGECEQLNDAGTWVVWSIAVIDIAEETSNRKQLMDHGSAPCASVPHASHKLVCHIPRLQSFWVISQGHLHRKAPLGDCAKFSDIDLWDHGIIFSSADDAAMN
jgi:hypothetical protein